MKKLILASLMTTLSSGAFAHGIEGKDIATLATIAPFISTYQCMGKPNVEVCSYASSSSTVAALSSVLLLKEDIKSVEGDAYNYIAGEPMTLALEEQIENVRKAANQELDKASDEEVVVLMIELLK